jgi:general secretion pathway protein D
LTGINVTFDEQFQDRQVDLRIDGLTLEETLDHVLSTNQAFYKVLNPRTIIVVPETTQKRAQYDEQVIRTFYVSHADVQELSQLLSQIVRVPQMAVQPSVIPNTVANTITVRATTGVTAIVEQVIAANDKPAAEIIIDVEILEVNRERAKQYGLNLTDYALSGVFSPEVAPPTDAPVPFFNLNTISRGVSTADFYLGVPAAVVRFLETDSKTDLVANPQLRGQEGQLMTLSLGEEIPVPSTTFTPFATGGANVNPLTSFVYRDVGVIVEITPRVTFENEIVIDLRVENSTLGANIDVAGTSLPTFGTREVVTRLRLRDGESNLLAGLLREEDRRTLRGIPGISQVPILRKLFGDSDSSRRQTDIVMLLTPRIVRTHELTQRDVSPIHIGTQTNFGLTGPPPLIAPQPDAAVPDAAVPDAQSPLPLPSVPAPPPGTVDTPGDPTPVPDAPAPDPLEPVSPEVPAPVEPEPETATTTPVVPALIQVLVTPPTAQFRIGGGPYTVPISLSGASQLSSISLTMFFDPNVLRLRTVQEGSFLRQGGLNVAFTQQVDREAGRVDITATRANDATGAAGGGLLAAVLFDTVGPGSVTLETSGTAMATGGAPLALEFSPVTVAVR